jgi:hypothetical protein
VPLLPIPDRLTSAKNSFPLIQPGTLTESHYLSHSLAGLILGDVEAHVDPDAAMSGRIGNSELPETLALPGYRYVNSRMWKKAGIRTS